MCPKDGYVIIEIPLAASSCSSSFNSGLYSAKKPLTTLFFNGGDVWPCSSLIALQAYQEGKMVIEESSFPGDYLI